MGHIVLVVSFALIWFVQVSIDSGSESFSAVLLELIHLGLFVLRVDIFFSERFITELNNLIEFHDNEVVLRFASPSTLGVTL